MNNYYNQMLMQQYQVPHPSYVDLMQLEQQQLQNLNAFKGVEEKLENLKSSAGHLLGGIENLAIDEGKYGSSLGLELTENAMILPLVDSHGQTQLVVIDRSTELAREVLTSYFETGTVPLLTPPLIEEPLLPFVPIPPMAEPFVAPLPIVAPVPVPVPFVAPVHVNPMIVPLEEVDMKTKVE